MAKVLVVEHPQETLRVVSLLAELAGHETVSASSVDEARRIGADGSFELLIADLELPNGSGAELMSFLRGCGSIRGIALVTSDYQHPQVHDDEEGFDRHLLKPVEFEALESAIRQLLP